MMAFCALPTDKNDIRIKNLSASDASTIFKKAYLHTVH